MLSRIRTNSWVVALTSIGQSYGVMRGDRMAAAVAYRTIFAAAPLLLIAVAVLGRLVGGSVQARQSILESIEDFAGSRVAEAVEGLMISASATSGITALIGFALFLWTASTLFLEVQNSLNDIFGVPYLVTAGLGGLVRKRLVGFLWALGLGLLTGAVWLLNATWYWASEALPENLGLLRTLVGWLTPLVSLVVLPFVFALSFRTMAAVSLDRRALWLGGLFTAVIFIFTAVGTRVYFRWESASSASQFATGFFVLLLLAYLLSTAFLLGAHVTRFYNDRLNEHPPS